jgi:hypothetical protein
MNDYKEKLLEAVQDGVIDAAEVVEKLLSYVDEDSIAELVDNEGWDIGIRNFDEYGTDE